ncbi:MAG TPA: hypothetical protein PKL16_10505, partial [Anaerolineae bacterium]|nr:hypothetical protein [Anaerolineae bacterium]HQM14819.1 hypothetical protein [Anaerolineae bacterium]
SIAIELPDARLNSSENRDQWAMSRELSQTSITTHSPQLTFSSTVMRRRNISTPQKIEISES